jgi:hypothetical protein
MFRRRRRRRWWRSVHKNRLLEAEDVEVGEDLKRRRRKRKMWEVATSTADMSNVVYLRFFFFVVYE